MTNRKRLSILRILGMLMACIIAMSFISIPASAATTTAFSNISSSKVMKAYTIQTSNTICYTSNTLKTRGSVTYGASKTAYISGSDELYVIKIGKNSNGNYYAYVSYPIGSKRAMAYIPLSAITSNNANHTKTTATGTVYTSKRAGASTEKNKYVEKGDTVYLISTSGNNYQIMYNVSGGWRLAWISKANYNKYCKGGNVSTGTSNTSGTNSSGSTGYNVSNNIVILKGVSLYEYPIGSTVPSSSLYFNVNGRSTYMGATQCYGYACYVETKLYGCCWHTQNKTAKNHFPNVPGSKNIKPTASQFKSLIEKAGIGAHIRTGTGDGKHSLIVASINSNGLTIIDANKNGSSKVALRTYTWSSFLSENPSIAFIEYYEK